MRSASRASTIRPLITSSAARPGPTRRGREYVAPQSGCRPMRLNVNPMEARSLAMRKSHARASDAPAPAAGPFTAAITGCSMEPSRRTTRIPASTSVPKVASSPRCSRSLITSTSAPVHKPRPAPVMTITRTSGPVAARSSAS